MAKVARQDLEKQLGRSVVSREKASDYLPPADSQPLLPEEEDDETMSIEDAREMTLKAVEEEYARP